MGRRESDSEDASLKLYNAMIESERDPVTLKPNLIQKIKAAVPGWSVRADEAFVALLEIAVFIDRESHADEKAELSALLQRSRTVKKLDLENRAGRLKVQKFMETLKDPKTPKKVLWNYVIECCLAIKAQPQRLALYSHVVDILFADRRLVDREIYYINALAKLLRIRNHVSFPIMEIIRLKNEVRLPRDMDSNSPVPPPRRPINLEPDQPLVDPPLRQLFVLTPEAAHYAVLYCAIWADKTTNPPENHELDALWRAPSLAVCGDNLRRAIKEYVAWCAKELGFAKFLDKALEYIAKEDAKAIFAQSVDLVLVDSFQAPEEAAFLAYLRKKLNIDAKDAEAIVKVIQDKNEY